MLLQLFHILCCVSFVTTEYENFTAPKYWFYGVLAYPDNNIELDTNMFNKFVKYRTPLRQSYTLERPPWKDNILSRMMDEAYYDPPWPILLSSCHKLSDLTKHS